MSKMHRREWLSSIGAASSVAITGCAADNDDNGKNETKEDTNGQSEDNSEDKPEEEPEEEPEEDNQPDYSTYAKNIQSYLEKYEFTAPDARYTGEHIQVDYISGATSTEGLQLEVAMVIGGYLDQIAEEGMEPIRLESRILGADSEPVGSYYIKKEWGKRYQTGEFTVEQVTDRTANTVDPVDDD